MPIVTNSRPYTQANPAQGEESPWVFFPRKDKARVSNAFDVVDQPVVITAAGLKDDDEILLQVSPDGVNFSDFMLHNVQIKLTAGNVMVVLRIPGTYRLLKYVGAMYVNVVGMPVTLTHEPHLPLTLPASGAPGSVGPQGARGPKGDEGPQGPVGFQGPQGERGHEGATGAQGVQGPFGPVGPMGVQGPQGLAGSNGTDGIDGAQGPQGDVGAQGDVGPQGDTGAQGQASTEAGPQGLEGAQGPQGPQGEMGPMGYEGPQGHPGVQGVQGIEGVEGPQGVQGDIGVEGPPGTSASILRYRADANSTSMTTDPGTGYMRWNAVVQSESTELSFDRVTDEGFDATLLLTLATIGNRFIVQDVDLANHYQVWEKTGPGVLMGSDWFVVPVAFTESGGNSQFNHNTKLGVVIQAHGSKGDVGPQGEVGPQGVQGEVGAQGPQGDVGIMGPNGPQGVPGQKGDPGAQGAASNVAGPQGPQGVQGAIGAGVQGAVGSQGPQGYQGIPGTGAQGPQGPSLFIIASVAPPIASTPVGAAWWDLDNGRTFILYDDGTSKQWMEFIGAPGPQGFQGPIGVQGVAGTPGAQGAQGAAGVTPAVPGTNTQVIFNDNGVLAGNANFFFLKNTGQIAGIGGSTAATPTFVASGTQTGMYRNSTSGHLAFAVNGVEVGVLTTQGYVVPNGYLFGWTPGASPVAGSVDTWLSRNAVNQMRANVHLVTTNLYAEGTLRADGTTDLYGMFNARGGSQLMGTVNPIASGSGTHQVQSGGVGHAAYLAYHIPGQYAEFMGLDTDNQWKVGGWSAGAGSWRIWHERNSFNWGWWANSIGSSADSLGRDIVVHRNNNSGLIWMGNSITNSISYDGAKYNIVGRVMISTQLSVNGAPALLGNALAVRMAANQNVVLSTGGTPNYPHTGCLNDANTAWTNLTHHNQTGFLPLLDVTQTMGDSTHRWTYIYASSGTISTSDRRGKNSIVPSDLGLAFINELDPVSYVQNVAKNHVERVVVGEEEIPEHYTIDNELVPAQMVPKYEDHTTPIPGVRTHYGLIAQDVRAALDKVGVRDFGGLVIGDEPWKLPKDVDPDGLQGLNYSEFIAPLIKAVQELSAKVKELEGKLSGSP